MNPIVPVQNWTTRGSQFEAFSGTYSSLVTSGPLAVTPFTFDHFLLNLTSANGIILQWGADAQAVGIDNVVFEITEIPQATVPEPGTMALLGAGLTIAGIRRWRRR